MSFYVLSKCQQCQIILDLDLWVSVTGYKRDTSSGDVSHVCSYDCISWQHVMYKISYTTDGRTNEHMNIHITIIESVLSSFDKRTWHHR